jgi:hypothetical protein
MANLANYDIKRAFVAGAKVRAEFPGFSVGQCLPRGEAGDIAYRLWCEECTAQWTYDFDMVLFLLMLGESMVHP